MPLWVPPAGFADMQHNLPSTPSVSTEGTAVTASGSTNTKGSWVALIASANFEVQMIGLMISDLATSAAAPPAQLVDIGVGGAGSEQVVLPNLLCGGVGGIGALMAPLTVLLPLRIAKGSRIAARTQSSTASKVVDVAITLFGGPSDVAWPAVSGADDIGTNTATSKGTAITPGSSGAAGTWTNVGSTTAKPYKGLLLLHQGGDSNMIGGTYHNEVGAGSASLGGFWTTYTSSGESYGGIFPPFPQMRSVPTGTQLQARSTCSGTPDPADMALYGLY